MTNFLLDLKNAVTGNYTVKTTPSAGIKPTPYQVAYSIEEMNQVFERGMKHTGNARPKFPA